MRRRLDKHIDSEELNALVPTRPEGGARAGRPSPVAGELQSHLDSCADCRERLRRYQRLVNGISHIPPAKAAPGPDCPSPEDVNWDEVVAGHWPELKARQLILHAATCDYCGPQLKQAARLRQGPVLEKKTVLATPIGAADPISSLGRPAQQFLSLKLLAGVLALFVIVGLWKAAPDRSLSPLSGPEIAQLAVATHRKHAAGHFPLQMVTGSSQSLNEWLQANSRLTVSMPPVAAADTTQVYRPEGVRLLQVNRETAAYVAYEATTPDSAPADVSLVVAPSSAAIASGGDEVDFPKVSFHYTTVDGFKVVTWTVHGMTYALVSQEARTAQRSCLVCHSSLQDPALHRSPKFIGAKNDSLIPVWQ